MLAEAALEHAAELLFVLPERFPHKQWHGPDSSARLDLLQPLLGPRHSLAQSEGGLFVDIAREARRHYPRTEFWFVCGRDAAERILTWDYADGVTAESLLEQFGLLVAPRAGVFHPPAHLSHRIRSLDLAPEWSDISSTAVRERLARGESWQHLVPEPLHAAVARLYGQSD